MMHPKPRFVQGSALLGLFAACGTPSPVTPTDEVYTQLAGLVSLEGPVSGARVRVVAAEDEAATFGEGWSDDTGTFSADLGPLYGSVRLLATVEGSEGLETLQDTKQGETVSDVQLSPLTTLHAAWVRGALQRGEGRARALQQAEDLVFGHFGALDHARIAPADLRDDGVAIADDGVRAGLFVHGLAEQAQRLSRRSQGQGAGPVTLLALVAAYGRDLEDGLADGIDRFGAPITLGAVRLTPDSLRLDLSMAIGAFLDGPRNGTRFRSSDFVSVLQALREAQGPLFPEGSLADRDQVGPTVQLQWQRGEEHIAPDRPVTGQLSLVVTAEDPSGVAALQATAGQGDALGEATWMDRVIWPVDSTTMPQGQQVITVQATDALGFVSTTTIGLQLDHTAPTVSLRGPEQVHTPTVPVSGSWFDAQGVTQVVLRVDGEPRVTLDRPTIEFEATVVLGCRQGETKTVSAEAVDRAGNTSAPAAVRVRCTHAGPTLVLLPSEVIDERGLTFEHGSDGALIRVRSPSNPQRFVLDERAVWPVRVFKLFTRLDLVEGQAHEATNLPVFRMRAQGVAPLVVDYRYLVDGQVVRPWSPLTPDASGQFKLPMTYQTFGLELVTAGSDIQQSLEVRVEAAEGDAITRTFPFFVEALSPPVWLGACESALTGSELRQGYSGGAQMQLETAQMRWDLGLDDASVAPSAGAQVQFVVPTAHSEITELGEVKFREGAFGPAVPGGPSPTASCSLPHSGQPFWQVHDGLQSGLCGGVAYPAMSAPIVRTGGAHGALSRQGGLSVLQQAWWLNNPVTPAPGGRVSVQPDQA